MQQYIQGFLPTSFNQIWTTNVNRPDRVYQLRNDFELYVPPARLSLTQKHPYHSFPSAWREFNEYNIKIQREKNIFNSMLKKYFIEKLNSHPSCSRLLCPTCHLPPLLDLP